MAAMSYITSVRKSKASGKLVGTAILTPSVDQFMIGGQAQLVRFMAIPEEVQGGELDLANFKVGTSEDMPARTDGKPGFARITWLDRI
jgi:hypothetical protein